MNYVLKVLFKDGDMLAFDQKTYNHWEFNTDGFLVESDKYGASKYFKWSDISCTKLCLEGEEE